MAQDCGGIKKQLIAFKKRLDNIRTLDVRRVLFSGKGRKKPAMFNNQEITDKMVYDISLGGAGKRTDALLKLNGSDAGIISNPEIYKKIYKALDKSKDKNAVLKDLTSNIANEKESGAVGQVIKFRSVALAEILSAIESEANIQENIGLKDQSEIKRLFNDDGSRKVSLTSIRQTVGKALAENMGFKISADPIVANSQYGNLGMIAIESLEDAGIVKTTENDTILNNDFKKESTEDYSVNGAKVLTGFPTVSVVLDSLLDEKDQGIQSKRDNLQKAFTESDPKRLAAHETAAETVSGIAAVSRMVIPTNFQIPPTSLFDLDSDFSSPRKVRDLGDMKGNNITEPNQELLKTMQEQEQMVNPMVGKLILHMKKTLDEMGKNTDLSPEATLKNLYKALGFREAEIQHSVFGSLDTATPDDFKSKVGQSISKENPMLQLILTADHFFNEDGTSIPYHQEYGEYRTTRIECLSTVLNEQMDKAFARAMVVGEAVTIDTDSALGELIFNDTLHSLVNDLKGATLGNKKITIGQIMGDESSPELNKIIALYQETFQGKNTKVKDQLNYISSLAKGSIGREGLSFDLPGSVWNQLSIIEALSDISDMNNGDGKTFTTVYRTKPDAAASGVMLSFAQNIGKDSGSNFKVEDDIFSIMRRMGYTFETVPSEEQLDDAYDILIQEVKEASERELNNDSDTQALMDKLKELNIFEAIRDMAKPMTMTTNYQAGGDTAIASTSADLREIVMKKMIKGKMNKKAFDFIKEKIKKNDSTFYKENNVGSLGQKGLSQTPGVNNAVEAFFTEELSTPLRKYIDEALEPAMGKYKERMAEIFAAAEKVFNRDLVSPSKKPGDKVLLAIIPSMAWMTMSKEERNYLAPNTKEFAEHHMKMLRKYGMPLTSKKQVMVEMENGEKVLITKEVPNALTLMVNAIHGIDSAIFFLSHMETLAEIKEIIASKSYNGTALTANELKGFNIALKNASGLIHDANNADPYYNFIYSPHYRRNSVEVSSEYDIEEQIAMTYMSYEGANDAFSKTLAEKKWKDTQERKAKKQEALKSINKETHRFFGFEKGRPQSKEETESTVDESEEVVPETTVETDSEPTSSSRDIDFSRTTMKEYNLIKNELKKGSLNKEPSGHDGITGEVKEFFDAQTERVMDILETGEEFVAIDLENTFSFFKHASEGSEFQNVKYTPKDINTKT